MHVDMLSRGTSRGTFRASKKRLRRVVAGDSFAVAQRCKTDVSTVHLAHDLVGASDAHQQHGDDLSWQSGKSAGGTSFREQPKAAAAH